MTINRKKEYLREVSVSIEATEVNKRIDKILNEYKDRIFIPGFRKGFIPREVILKKLGKGFEAMAVQELIEEAVQQIVKEKNFHLAGETKISDLELAPDKSLHFTALLEIFPEFDLKEYKEIPVTEPKITGFEQEFEKRVRALQEKCAIYRSVGKPAERGNILIMDYEVFSDEEQLEKVSAYRFRLGDENNLAELNEGLLGIERGESREVRVRIPDEHPEERIAGREVTFKILVRDVKEEELPELDEDFAKNLGYESLEKMGEEIKESILDSWAEIKFQAIQRQIEEFLLREHNFEPPVSMVERICGQLIAENKLEDNEEVREKILPIATRRAKLWIIISRIAEKENLSPTNEEIEKFLSTLSLSDAERAKLAESQFVREKILEEKVMKFLVKEAKIGGADVLHTNRD